MPRFACLFALAVIASAAFAQLKSNLPFRLPSAYETYRNQLIKNSRADELKMTALDMTFESIGPKDSTWTERRSRPGPFAASKSAWVTAMANGGPGILPGAKVPDDEDSYDCTDMIASHFEIAPGESLLFTVGRTPEACNETPYMIQKHGALLGPRERLPDLLDYNVESIWYT